VKTPTEPRHKIPVNIAGECDCIDLAIYLISDEVFDTGYRITCGVIGFADSAVAGLIDCDRESTILKRSTGRRVIGICACPAVNRFGPAACDDDVVAGAAVNIIVTCITACQRRFVKVDVR
jgi:hypothetical protein